MMWKKNCVTQHSNLLSSLLCVCLCYTDSVYIDSPRSDMPYFICTIHEFRVVSILLLHVRYSLLSSLAIINISAHPCFFNNYNTFLRGVGGEHEKALLSKSRRVFGNVELGVVEKRDCFGPKMWLEITKNVKRCDFPSRFSPSPPKKKRFWTFGQC